MLRKLALLLLLCATSARAQDSSKTLPAQVVRILESRCGDCHGKVNPQSGLNVLDHTGLLDGVLSNGDSVAVVNGEPDDSELWNRIASKDADVVMPPGEPLPDRERAVIRQWIESGAAPFPSSNQRRPFVSARDIYAAVDADLQTMDYGKARDQRYFSLTHLHNNPQVSGADLRYYRAAMSKLLNSLSWKSEIFLPQAIDEHETILRIDLGSVGWAKNGLWKDILAQYPYGLAYDSVRDDGFATAASRVYLATGSQIPIVRADWFVARASVPPLYHDLLMLPNGPGADQVLERRLGVETEKDFLKNRLLAAGFTKSNVSDHNRLVHRHQSQFGYYWESYDFKSSRGRQNLAAFSLGPDFEDNPFARVAFEHDGGEIIFSLPNGLQGYMLVDGNGGRIDRGPLEVVFDSKQPLGNKEVINGISCIVCHNRGMQPFQDDIRNGTSLTGRDRRKVDALYPSNKVLEEVVRADSDRFLSAQRRAVAAFLTDADNAVTREPVGAIAGQFTQELFLTDISAELQVEDSSSLEALFRDRTFSRFGLAIVADGGVMKRETWEGTSPDQRYSIYQQIAEQLRLGIPVRVIP